MAAVNPLTVMPSMAQDLARVESRLVESATTQDPTLTEIATHLIAAGGKRVRPGFTIAAAATAMTLDAPASEEAVTGGVAVELVHLGSLYHDDVMDEAEVRRTVDSVNARWGNLRAILAGDFLLARASELAASLGVEVAGLLAAAMNRGPSRVPRGWSSGFERCAAQSRAGRGRAQRCAPPGRGGSGLSCWFSS